MQCPKCGAEVNESALFCQQCGAKLKEAPADAGSPARGFAAAMGQRGGEPPEEETLWEGGFSAKAMLGTWILSGLLTVAAIVVGVLFITAPPVWLAVAGVIAVAWLAPLALLGWRRLSLHYRLTNQRFFHQSGVLRRVTDRIEVIDMDDISFEQGLIERFVGVGTIHIRASDQSHPELELKGIDNVERVASLIDEARRVERTRRGVYVESV